MNKKNSSLDKGFFNRLIDDSQRFRLQMAAVSTLFGFISAIMCVVNIMHDNNEITIATMMFALVCFINVAILAMGPSNLKISYWLFSGSFLMLATYLLISDETESGPLWLLLLPACGPMLMGKKIGSILTGLLALEVIYFMWVPYGVETLAGNFDKGFLVRYPIIFVSFFLVGFWLEYIRSETYNKLKDLQIRFQEMSIRDALTGIYNRHWINTEMPAVIKRCKGRISLGVMILDLDFFKNINDTYGHLFGDMVLKKIADILKDVVGERGNVCRWGGEEFAVLVENVGKEEAVELAESIREAVENSPFEDDGEEVRLTVSVGVTSMVPKADMRPGFLIDCADHALYEAKNSGRNQVRYHQETWRYREVDG